MIAVGISCGHLTIILHLCYAYAIWQRNNNFWCYQVIRDNLNELMDVTIFDAHVQPTSANLVGFNPCHEDNGHCQQLCFAIPDKQGPKCACAHGTLLGNGVSCGYEPDEFLVFSTSYTLNSQRLDPTDHSLPYPTVTLGNGVMGMDYDFREKRIFFAQYVGIGRSRIGYITTTSVTSPPVTIISSELSIITLHIHHFIFLICDFI